MIHVAPKLKGLALIILDLKVEKSFEFLSLSESLFHNMLARNGKEFKQWRTVKTFLRTERRFLERRSGRISKILRFEDFSK